MSWSRDARVDARLHARVRARRRLRYVDRDEGRPAHVRAASGLAWVGERLAVVQDDCLFVALVEPASGDARAIALPCAPDGARSFDDARGNKRLKPDLEACFVAPCDGEPRLVALGSGSSPRRERVAIVSLPPAEPAARWVAASRWYAMLRELTELAGSELNIEGAVLDGDRLRLFQRGNGAPRGGLEPRNAIAELSWPDLWQHLADRRAEPPRPSDVVAWSLGEIDGVRLGFTDAAMAPSGRIAFLAAAEASADAIADGPVTGTVLGVLDPDGGARTCVLLDETGTPLHEKAEGLAIDPAEPSRVFVAIAPDDPDAPAQLLELALGGPWWKS